MNKMIEIKEESKRNDYWSSILTEKSWQILQELRRKYEFVLIGGWAVYLFTKQQKSKDIDIVVSINELEKFKEEGLIKNERLRKYEIKKEEIDIDIYAEHYSKLAIPAEDINNYAIETEGFKIVCPELLLLLKRFAYEDRKNSAKGEKDKIDIASLLFFADIDFNRYKKIIKKYEFENYYSDLISIIKSFRDFNSIGLNAREFSIKKKKLIEKMMG